jgi:hypothetical protein
MARLFTLKTKENDMVVIEVGYVKLVLSNAKALALANILEEAEVYESKYMGTAEREKRGITTEYTYHVYPNDKSYEMKLVSESHYQMAKLAGKPEEN